MSDIVAVTAGDPILVYLGHLLITWVFVCAMSVAQDGAQPLFTLYFSWVQPPIKIFRYNSEALETSNIKFFVSFMAHATFVFFHPMINIYNIICICICICILW